MVYVPIFWVLISSHMVTSFTMEFGWNYPHFLGPNISSSITVQKGKKKEVPLRNLFEDKAFYLYSNKILFLDFLLESHKSPTVNLSFFFFLKEEEEQYLVNASTFCLVGN